MIQLMPTEQNAYALTDIIAQFYDGEHSLTGIPNDYRRYSVEYKSTAISTMENIDTILQWTNAVQLTLYDMTGGQITYTLFQRIDEMSRMKMLEQLKLTLQIDTYDKINLLTFVETFPKLKWIELAASSLSTVQKEKFAAMNPTPLNWRHCINSEVILFCTGYACQRLFCVQ